MNKSVLIIAEAGVNHNGDIGLAKELVNVAAECGADIVKFQTFNVDELVADSAVMAKYQVHNMGINETQKKMLKSLALNKKDFCCLANYCKKKEIGFLSTPFDITSIKFLDGIQNVWKIPSGEVTNYPYLVEIAKTGKDVLMSTGMCTLQEVDEALAVLKGNGAGNITLLHCTTEYPAAMNNINLKAMLTLRDHCGLPVGYSDHTKGIEVSVAAVALGATVIEKHFTVSRRMRGPDHMASLEPDELKSLVKAIRNIEMSLGTGIKNPTEAEFENRKAARKSIVASRNISKGEILTAENIATKRPGTGISPMRWNEVLGMMAKQDFCKDDLIVL